MVDDIFDVDEIRSDKKSLEEIAKMKKEYFEKTGGRGGVMPGTFDLEDYEDVLKGAANLGINFANIPQCFELLEGRSSLTQLKKIF